MKFRKERSDAHEISTERIESDEAQIDKFLDENSEDLLHSAQLWGDVSQRLQVFKSDERVTNAFQEGVAECMKNTMGTEPNQRQVDLEAARLEKLLIPYTYVAARRYATEKTGFINGVKEFNNVTRKYPGEGVPYIFGAGKFPILEYSDLFLAITDRVKQADGLSDKVLTELCRHYSTPSDVMLLGELSVEGAGEVSPMLDELSIMMAADWSRLDEEKSVLRQHCERLATDPSVHVASFCEDAARVRNGIPSSVNAMAQFALLGQNRDVTPTDRAKVLYEKRNQWPQVPDLQEAFNEYVNRSSSLVKTVFDELSSNVGDDGRNEYPDAEFIAICSNMAVMAIGNRQEARETTRNLKRGSKLYQDKPRLVDVAKNVGRLGSSAETLQEKALYFTRQTSGRGYELDDANELLSTESLTKYFNLPDSHHLAEDIKNVIEYLRQPDRNFRGSKRVRSNNGNIKIDGKPMSLWRFAPNDSPYVQVDSANRFYRVIYGTKEEALVVVDVLSHTDFDQRYK